MQGETEKTIGITTVDEQEPEVQVPDRQVPVFRPLPAWGSQDPLRAHEQLFPPEGYQFG